MAKNQEIDYSTAAASNTDIGGINIDEGMPPDLVNNAIRQALKQRADAIMRRVAKASAAGPFTAAKTDTNQFWDFTGSTAVTLNLTAAATLTTGWCLWIRTVSATTIDPNGAETIDGGATLVIPAGRTVLILCDGVSFYSVMSGAKPESFQIGRSAGGRLTLTTALPVTVSDVTGAATIYYTPYKDNIVWLFDGTSIWKAYVFSEVSLLLTGLLTASRPHDVFLYDNAGTLTLEVLAWTSDTARATAIVRQDGVWCKSGALTRRYLGTIYSTGTGTTEDSKANRYVWNVDNRTMRSLRAAIETADGWNYTTATLRQANANTANQLNFVRGIDEDSVEATVTALFSNPTNNVLALVAIGLDSTTTRSSDCHGGTAHSPGASNIAEITCSYRGYPGLGKHSLVWLEYSAAVGTTGWIGDSGSPTLIQSGIIGNMPA